MIEIRRQRGSRAIDFKIGPQPIVTIATHDVDELCALLQGAKGGAPQRAASAPPWTREPPTAPRWSTEPPTKPGLYWVRLVKESSSGVVYSNGGQVVLVDLKSAPRAFDVLSYDLWCGPITPPELP